MQLLRRLSFTMLLMSMMTLVACGDGDGDLTGGDDGGTTPDTVTLTVTKSEGDLSMANDVTVSATVLDNGAPVVDKIVTFTLNASSMATFSPAVGTAVTDSAGIASIIVKVTDVPGGVEVIATISDLTPVAIGFTSVGDGQGPPPVGEPVAASITLFSNTQQLASSGAQLIDLTAIAKDASNNLLEGVTINFASDSGSLNRVVDEDGSSSNITGADGKVVMQLSTPAEPTNRVITTTITSGDVSDALEIEVVGTTITLTGTSSLALNDEATYIVKLLNSDGVGVAKAPVTVSLSGISTETPAGDVATITLPTTVTTDAEGQAVIKATGSSAGTNRIEVQALGATEVQNVSVQSDSFLFTSFSNGLETTDPSSNPIVPDVSLDPQTASITLTWTRDGVAVPDGTLVTFTTTRGMLTTNTATTVAGKVTATLKSVDAGKALVTFVGFDTVDSKDIELTNQLEFEFFAENAATIKAQASPNAIGPNQQTSTISVVVHDANGNLVKNKKIKFILSDVSGGSIFPATAITDSSGSASTIYTSNSISAQNAVSIEAIVEDAPAITDTVTLTVADRELFITLGTGNTLEILGETDYIQEYSIFVTDVDSAAVPNVELTVSAIPDSYYKGIWFPFYNGEEFDKWIAVGTGSTRDPRFEDPRTKCPNEDINFNGILDAGEDFNGDGELTPGNVVAIAGNQVTDENGRSVIIITYPQSYGNWVDITLIVSAKVTGTESKTQAVFTLKVAEKHIDSDRVTPPLQGVGNTGPFGHLKDCSKNIADEA